MYMYMHVCIDHGFDIVVFFSRVRQALDGIMRALDHSVGRSFVQTNSQVVSRPEEILG